MLGMPHHYKLIVLSHFRQCHAGSEGRFLRRGQSDESCWFTHEHREFDWLLYQVLAKFPYSGVCFQRRLAFFSEGAKKKGNSCGIHHIQPWKGLYGSRGSQ